MTTKKMRLALVAALIGLAAIVVLQNTETVETKLLFATLSMPRALLLAVTLGLGILIGLLLGMRRQRRQDGGHRY